jgi:hypothetical protein
MKNEFIPYELALELKQLGFDEPCFAWYGNGKLHSDIDLSMTDSLYCQKDMEPSNECTAPTYSQAFRFFREKYKLKCCIIPLVCEQGFSDLYESRIHQEKHSISRIGNYKTYEEAELACLKKLIETIR